MAQASRAATMFRRRQPEDEEGNPIIGKIEEQIVAQSHPSEPQRPQISRAAMMFDTEPGPAEREYSTAMRQPEPGYEAPKKLGFWKTLGAIGLGAAAGRGADVVSRNVFDAPEERAQEDYARRVGAHRRQIGGLKEAADFEAGRRRERNTAMWRTGDLNTKFARNQREESLLPRRMKLLESQIGKEDASAGAQKALAEQRRRPNAGRAPFRPLSPGQGTFDTTTGKVLTPADPAAARAARPSGGTTGNADARTALGVVQRRIKNEQDQAAKKLAALTPKNLLDPLSDTPSTNAIARQRIQEESKRELEKLERQELHLLRQMQLLAPDESQEDDGFSEPGEGDEADAMGADASDKLAAGQKDDDPPHGTIVRDRETGERLMWDSDQREWVRPPG